MSKFKAAIFLLLCLSSTLAAARRKVIINEDCSGPGGSNMQTLVTMIQSPEVEVLGITVVSGDQWLDEEVAHTLRLLEMIGRTDIPVVPGAEYPLVHTRQQSQFWQQRYGKVAYAGAWDERWWHEASVIPPLPEGQPRSKPADGDAASFLIRMVHKYPNEVTIYAGGPMTNLALAISIDPEFPKLAQELVFMGGSLNPQTDDPEFANTPRHEFNLWFDPEASHIVLRAPWKKIVCTPVDVSVKTQMTTELLNKVKSGNSPAAHYIRDYGRLYGKYNYLWDELAAAAWLDPSLITKTESKFLDVNLDRGAGYGDTLTWTEQDKPKQQVQPVEVQMDLDTGKFYKMFVDLLTAPTPMPSK